VRALNQWGVSGPSNEINGTVGPPPCTSAPPAPGGLSGSVNGNSVSLSWNASSGGCAATSYVVEAGSSPGGQNFANTDVGGATSYSVGNVAVGTYYVRVHAHNAYGDSGPSNEISGSVLCTAAPPAPGGLSGSVNGNSVSLWWNASSGGCAATSYVVEAGSSPGGQNFANTDVGGATSYSVGNVAVGTYYVRVRAQNAYGASGPSNEITGSVQCTAAPPAPGGLSGSVNGNSVSLSWNASSGGCVATSYVVEAGSSPGGQNFANTDVGGATSYAVGNVAAGTYYVRVHAHNAYGDSGPSNEISGSVGPPPCTAAPPAPTGFSGSTSGGTVTLWWTAPSGGCAPTSYVIESGSGPGLSDIDTRDVGSATSFSASGVAAGTYYIRVRARNAHGDSGASNEISGTVSP